MLSMVARPHINMVASSSSSSISSAARAPDSLSTARPQNRGRPISTERAPRASERMVTRQESVGEFPAVFDRQAGDIKVVIEMDS